MKEFYRMRMNIFRELSILMLLFAFLSPVSAQQFTLPPNSTYQGHFNSAPSAGPPTGAGCTIATGSTDTDGSCTASAASGSITFATPFNQSPFCSVIDASATSTVSMPVYTVSTTTITLSTIISTHVLFWHCTGKNGG